MDNLFENKLQMKQNDHNGLHWIKAARLYQDSLSKKVDFIDIAVIPPGSSIGDHQHENNEETYVILDGNASMHVNGNKITVKKGDLIVNPPFGRHGLINDSKQDLFLLVYQTSLKK